MRSKRLTWIALLLVATILSFSIGIAFAATEGHGEDSTWNYGVTGKMTWRIINSLVLLVVMWYLLKKPTATFFRERKAQIAKDLEDAKLQRERAERTLKEYEAKMAGMEKEIERLKAEIKKSADVESEKVLANADRMAAAMVESARLAAEQEVRKAKAELQAESVDLAVEMAEAVISEKIRDDDQKKIVEEYLSKVGGMK